MLCLRGEYGALDPAFGGLVRVKGRVAKIGELVILDLLLDSRLAPMKIDRHNMFNIHNIP
jgi:hypothetical protein